MNCFKTTRTSRRKQSRVKSPNAKKKKGTIYDLSQSKIVDNAVFVKNGTKKLKCGLTQ